jgi:tripartite-type tricarboxylate transporter receptor subunit TctC
MKTHRPSPVRRALLLAALAAGAAAPAFAQGDKPIRLLVGFPPGGASDTIARVLAEKLPPVLRQPVLVENRPGVGGRLAAQAVKAAAPDGLTYMVAPNATFVFQHLTYPVSVLGYDMTKDFTSVARINSYPMAMVVSAATGVKTPKDYVAWRKTAGAQATFGTAGVGGDTHFNGLQFGRIAGVEMSVVPYRGNGPLVNDLLGGQILAGNMVAGDAVQHVRAGKLNYLGVFAKKRSPVLPDVPTMAEAGVAGAEISGGWFGMFVPAGTAAPIVARLAAEIKTALAEATVRQRLATLGLRPIGSGSEEFRRYVDSEIKNYAEIVKLTGIQGE